MISFYCEYITIGFYRSFADPVEEEDIKDMRWHSIFSDVDGTLINTHFEVTQQTRQALLCAMRQGLRIIELPVEE